MEIILDKRLIPANSRTGWVKSYPKCDAPNLVDGELKSVVSHFANLQFDLQEYSLPPQKYKLVEEHKL